MPAVFLISLRSFGSCCFFIRVYIEDSFWKEYWYTACSQGLVRLLSNTGVVESIEPRRVGQSECFISAIVSSFLWMLNFLWMFAYVAEWQQFFFETTVFCRLKDTMPLFSLYDEYIYRGNVENMKYLLKVWGKNFSMLHEWAPRFVRTKAPSTGPGALANLIPFAGINQIKF